QNAQTTTLMLMGAGATVVLVTLLGGWWFMQNIVLKPVRQLHDTSQALATGDLAARVDIRGDDELAQLGRCFNEMAANLENTLQEIQEKDAFLQGLVDAVPDGLRVIDKDFRVILSNSAYRNQLNLAPEDGAGNPCYATSHGRAEPCPPTLVTCPVHEILRRKQTVKIFDQHQSSDDRPLPVEVVAAPLAVTLHGESKILVVESIRDLEKQVQFSQEQRLAGLGQLAAGIAHEIHNPLSSIRLALDFLLRTSKQTEADPAKLHEYLMIVDKQIDRCIDVTERLLKLSSSAEHTHLVGVNAAIEETVSVVAWEAMAKNVTINQNLDSAQPRVLATESEYRMVVLNLIQNAFHAMPEGGHLDICSERRDGQVVLIVKDTGVGITREHQPHIFEPFFSHRADSNVGTGLGLSICKAITDRYGGHIDVDSQPGHGSRFRVVFSDAEVGERSTRE
ncbi:MAG: HAMP domain-containing protein, partial [Gammaproteobacteria bacterium]|nr:HAMP domain-containing protein [Gammaproteobacteria bacterium]